MTVLLFLTMFDTTGALVGSGNSDVKFESKDQCMKFAIEIGMQFPVAETNIDTDLHSFTYKMADGSSVAGQCLAEEK